MSKVPTQATNSQLQSLLAEIQEQFNRGLESYREVLEHARAIGERLIAAKKLVGHGKWRKWVQDNLPFSIDKAERMMRLHRERDQLNSAEMRFLGVTDAIAYLTAQKKKAKQGEHPAAGHETSGREPAGRRSERSDDDAGAITGPEEDVIDVPVVEAAEENDCRPGTAEAGLPDQQEYLDDDEFLFIVAKAAEDEAEDELCSVRDCYVDPAEADWFSPEAPLAEDAFDELESMITEMDQSLDYMLDHDAVEPLSDGDPLRVALLRLQQAVWHASASLQRKRSVAYAA